MLFQTLFHQPCIGLVKSNQVARTFRQPTKDSNDPFYTHSVQSRYSDGFGLASSSCKTSTILATHLLHIQTHLDCRKLRGLQEGLIDLLKPILGLDIRPTRYPSPLEFLAEGPVQGL